MDRADTGTLISPDQALRALDALPPFSPTLTRLMSTLLNDSVPLTRIVEIVENDVAISGNELRIVNSAMYGRRGTVDSIRQAVSLLGINKLRNAVFAMSLTGVWRQTPGVAAATIARFNLHSVACAVMSDLLARNLYPAYATGAFAAGLLHDIGAMLIAIAFPEEYDRCNRLHEAASRLHAERCLVGISHAELSAEALCAWNLPEALQRAVRFHHCPEADPSPVRMGDVTLSSVVSYADVFVTQAGYEFEGEAEPRDETNSLPALGAALHAPELVSEFNAEMSVLSPVFS